MIPQPLHSIRTSFMLYLDNLWCSRGQAYQNYSGSLYNMPSPQDRSFDCFTSPFRQWVADSSVSGANICSGVWDQTSTFIPTGTGVIPDYNNGRILTNKGLVTGSLTTTFAMKEINLFMSTESEQQIIFDGRLQKYPEFPNRAPTTGINANVRPYPCAYLIAKNYNAIPFQIGGGLNYKYTMRVILMADSDYLLEGATSLAQSQRDKFFIEFPPALLPFNQFGGLKSGVFNYAQMVSSMDSDPAKMVFIERVNVSLLDTPKLTSINENASIAIIDFDLCLPRFP